MQSKVYWDTMPFADRLQGMRECLAYIRQEALAYRLDAVADCLSEACEEIDAGIAELADRPREHQPRWLGDLKQVR